MKAKYFNKWEFQQLLNLYETNPFEAKLKYEEYLDKYPKDYSAYSYYASLLIVLGEFDEAEKILDFVEFVSGRDSIFSKDPYKLMNFRRCVLSSRLRLLSYQEKYDELYNLCLHHFQDIKNMDMMYILFYCKKKLGLLDSYKRSNYSYLFRQTVDYQESDFLYHIQKHLSDCNKYEDGDKKSVFVSNFPINKVIEEVKKTISSDKKLCYGTFQDIYIFRYNECGRDRNRLVDYFKVVCFHGTSDFITMCPSFDCQNFPYVDLNYLICDSKNAKVKRLSQIEKFNQKYKCN